MRIIAGTFKGRNLKTTTGPGFRPAMGIVREALFSMLEARGVDWPQTRVLDLFAGSGSLGFEALSRGAIEVCFVESATYATKVIAANESLLELPPGKVTIRQEEVAKVLSRKPVKQYSVVFIDPPYKLDALASTLNALIKNEWLAPDAIVNAEVEAKLKFNADNAHSAMELITERTYGQTRVVLWNAKQI